MTNFGLKSAFSIKVYTYIAYWFWNLLLSINLSIFLAMSGWIYQILIWTNKAFNICINDNKFTFVIFRIPLSTFNNSELGPNRTPEGLVHMYSMTLGFPRAVKLMVRALFSITSIGDSRSGNWGGSELKRKVKIGMTVRLVSFE